MPLQSWDSARLERRQKTTCWIGPLSFDTWEANFKMLCINELPAALRADGSDVCPPLAQQSEAQP